MDRPRILIVYGTDDGQTAKIAKRLGDELTGRGCLVDIRYGKNLTLDHPIHHYDGIVVGASVHMQRHQAYITDFVRAHVPFLEEVPTAFFSVSASAGSDRPADRRDAREMLDQFLDRTGWQPDAAECFGGAIRYTQYAPVKRFLMRLIAGLNGGDTDTTRDYEYTSWERVDEFAGDYFEMLGADVAPAPSADERAEARRIGGHPAPPSS